MITLLIVMIWLLPILVLHFVSMHYEYRLRIGHRPLTDQWLVKKRLRIAKAKFDGVAGYFLIWDNTDRNGHYRRLFPVYGTVNEARKAREEFSFKNHSDMSAHFDLEEVQYAG